MPGTTGGSPTGVPLGVDLGARLRKARQDTPGNLGVREVARALGWPHAQLSRFETGERRPKPELLQALLDYYVSQGLQLDDNTREQLFDDTQRRESAPWVVFSVPEQHRQLDTLLRFEQTATKITEVQLLLVPGLLQTENYTRAIMERAEVPEDQIETRVMVRVGRQSALVRRNNPAHLLALINQAALRQRIGGPRVMRDQLEELLDLARRPNVDLRIVPEGTDWHPGLESAFVLVEFADRTPVAHVEMRDTGIFIHRPEEVAPYEKAAQMVLREAMSAERSLKLIAHEAEQIT